MALDEQKPDGARRRKPTTAQSEETSQATFEEALEQLSAVVRDLEQGSLTLDDSLTRYEQGIRYLQQCQRMLATAERRIEVLSGFDAAGNPVTHALQDDDLTLEEKADSRSQRRSAGGKPTRQVDPERRVEPPRSSGGSAESRAEAKDVDFPGTLF